MSGSGTPPPSYSQVMAGYAPPQPGPAPSPADNGGAPQSYSTTQGGYTQPTAPPQAGYSGQPQRNAPQGYAAPVQPITLNLEQPQPATAGVITESHGDCPQCRQGFLVHSYYRDGLCNCSIMRQSYCNDCGHEELSDYEFGY